MKTFHWSTWYHWELFERTDKYFKISVALMIGSYTSMFLRVIPGAQVGLLPGAFPAYHLCRRIDDISDGDVQLPPEYASYEAMILDLKQSMATESYPKTMLGQLLQGTVSEYRTELGRDIRCMLSTFLDAMAFERQRRIEATISTRAQLADLYRNSFGVPQDLAFISACSKIRSADVPELAEAQGRIYAIGDLGSELQRGIVFIPREALPAGISFEYLRDNNCVMPEVGAWKAEEYVEGRNLLSRLKERKLDLPAKLVVGFLANGLESRLREIKATM
ncbi:MAG: hypothetical protein ABIA93_04040 [Candidatus Woesearchaeota archaeon]